MTQGSSTILVIGASGFLGRQVVKTLLAQGHTVRCLARDPARVQDLAAAGCEVVTGDMLNAVSIQRALQGVRAVYISVHTLSPQGANLAGQAFMDVEKTGLENIVAACALHGVSRLIYVTSIGTAPDAPSQWLRGRWKTEQFLLNSGLDVTIIRPGMIVGRGGTGFDAVLAGANRPVAFGLGSGQQKMRTVAVDDLAHSLVGVLNDPRAFGQAYDVGSDDVLTMDQMIDGAAAGLGRRPPIKIHFPAALLRLFAPLIERAGKLPRGAFQGLVDSLAADMSGDPLPIRALVTRPFQSYKQAVGRVLAEAKAPR
ncbi:NAD(P)H-binding protein [Deinococcus sp. Arct2-2]|uniref:SDR family oxidoreductase n=1 Tax=Deinococcus sp. Arct2-2 TaxID=2568653 RepID=UPI001454C33B|nr:NAD(P)H-binding protein [Deinococcus sp. Arct2-2]